MGAASGKIAGGKITRATRCGAVKTRAISSPCPARMRGGIEEQESAEQQETLPGAETAIADHVNQLSENGAHPALPRRDPKWRFALGAVEGRPAMLVFDGTGPMERPAYFVLITWSEDRIVGIRDFLFAPYVLEAIDWVRLG